MILTFNWYRLGNWGVWVCLAGLASLAIVLFGIAFLIPSKVVSEKVCKGLDESLKDGLAADVALGLAAESLFFDNPSSSR